MKEKVNINPTKLLSFICILAVFILGINRQSLSWAGQFITEDAVTTEYEHVEADLFSDISRIKTGSTIETPALEANVGVLPDLQGHMITPVVLFIPHKGSSKYGYGDIETGIKYRFIHETETMPQVAFYPKVTLPAGDVKLGTGLGGVTESIPFWFLKSLGSWKVSGGGGYTFSQSPHSFNYAFGGVLLQYEITKSFTLGGEFYTQGASLSDYGSTSIFTFGGNYNFTPTFAFLFSVGHNVIGARTLTGFLGLDWTWGPP